MSGSDPSRKRGLGRGLGALIATPAEGASAPGRALDLDIADISPNPYQPRSNIAEKDLQALSESIRDKGVLEPLLVRPVPEGGYQLIAGERRLRAASLAGLTRVPVLLRSATPSEMLELALIENLHREDLNPIEEAESYQRLSQEFGRSQEEIAKLSGRDRSTVANIVRLLSLPDPVQEDVRQGRLTAGHARALLGLPTPEQILAAREHVLARGLTVRETEALVKRALASARKSRQSDRDKAYFDSLADHMSHRLGLKVRIQRRGARKGRIEINFGRNEDLERVMAILGIDSF